MAEDKVEGGIDPGEGIIGLEGRNKSARVNGVYDMNTNPGSIPVCQAPLRGVAFGLDHGRRELLVGNPALRPGKELLSEDLEQLRIGDGPADGIHVAARNVSQHVSKSVKEGDVRDQLLRALWKAVGGDLMLRAPTKSIADPGRREAQPLIVKHLGV